MAVFELSPLMKARSFGKTQRDRPGAWDHQSPSCLMENSTSPSPVDKVRLAAAAGAAHVEVRAPPLTRPPHLRFSQGSMCTCSTEPRPTRHRRRQLPQPLPAVEGNKNRGSKPDHPGLR